MTLPRRRSDHVADPAATGPVIVRRDVPTMYQASGKQRGTPGNSGDLTRPAEQAKMASTREDASFWQPSHNPKVAGSNPAPATKKHQLRGPFRRDRRRASLAFRMANHFSNHLAGELSGATNRAR